MIQITPQTCVLVAIEAVDGRKGIGSLAALCRDKHQSDPFSGCVFVFRSRSAQSIKVLVYDGQGARAGDLFLSLIHTCELNGVNSFDYLVELQRHASALAAAPGEWMPLNYTSCWSGWGPPIKISSRTLAGNSLCIRKVFMGRLMRFGRG